MSLINQERQAIEALLQRVDPNELARLRRLFAIEGLHIPGTALYHVRGNGIRFAGVSEGRGLGSRSTQRVAVFVPRPGILTLYEPPYNDVRSCDALVFVP